MDLFNKLSQKLAQYFKPEQKIISPLADQYGGDYIPNQAMAYSMANDQSRVEAAHQRNLAKGDRPQVLSAKDQYIPTTPEPTMKPIFNYYPSSKKPEVLPSSQEKQFQGKEPITWDNFIKLAEKEGKKRGYDWQTLVKQKALESAFGTSQFARERNNFGGIGAYDSNPNSAFSFESPVEYFDYYDKMVQKRFPEAYKVRNNPRRYVEELKKGGYATDPNYVEKVMNTPLKRGT